MQKKMLLALLLAASLLLSGCALITVDKDVDNARVIIDVNGETVTKGQLHNAVDYQLEQNEYMNQLYAMFGMSGTLATDHDTVEQEIIDAYISTFVTRQKAKAMGLDQMTEEELAQINETAETNYLDYLHQITDTYFANSDLDEEALHAKAEEYIAANGLTTKDDIIASATESKMIEKLQANTVKDVAVTEEDLTAALDEKIAADQSEFATSPDLYGYYVNNGTTAHYAPAGYRYVKHVLVKFTEEDQAVIDEKTAALTEAQTALSSAAEGEDTTELSAAVNLAQKAVEEATETASQNIWAKVEEIHAKATAEGADFDALVAEFNEDTGMPAIGYAIRSGYAYFVTEFTDAAMALENVGDVSAPVKSNYGYHILQYSADIPEGAVSLDSVRDTLEAEVLSAKQGEAYNAALEGWISEANVITYLDRLH